jgi:fused signal recognition particle receptor
MSSFAEKMKRLLGLGRLDEEFFEGLEDGLVESDVGASLSSKLVSELRAACKKKSDSSREAVVSEFKAILRARLKTAALEPDPSRLSVFLVLGVNGVGKTTTVAKMAARFAKSLPHSSIIMAACDTFRAGAVDQLIIHGERLGIRVVANRLAGDPGAVIYDAIEAAKASGARVVIADTAGRLHNKANLVKELEKIDKIARGRAGDADYRKILVLDGTTGQNGLRQAETFAEAVGIDALVLTKYDSSAKGGMALSLAQALGIGTAFVGTGEGYGDFEKFDPDAYVSGLVGD